MPRHLVTLPRSASGTRLDMELDIVSYGRRGPGGTLRLNSDQIQQIRRTVQRVPEVLVKVSGGARDMGGAAAHLQYIGRHGKLPVETDDGQALQGRGVARALVADWQLDLCRSQYQPKPREGQRDTRAKLVHHIVLSMPAGTPPEKVLEAARIFARENFALQYRYAMVLHTDQPHPHVHLVVKCEHEFEPGRRLYIRKDTLRQWREQFAALMREQGVAANATPRQLRGQIRAPLKDPIYRRLRALRTFHRLPAAERGARPPVESTFMRRKVEQVGKALQAGRLSPDPGRARLMATRHEVESDWRSTAHALRRQGLEALARQVEQFTRAMAPVRTDKEWILDGLRAPPMRKTGPRVDPGDQTPDRSR